MCTDVGKCLTPARTPFSTEACALVPWDVEDDRLTIELANLSQSGTECRFPLSDLIDSAEFQAIVLGLDRA